MFNLKNINKMRLDCPHLKHSLHFFYDEIRACCSNAQGPVFYPNYNGEEIDWNKIYNIRKKYINDINSIFSDTSVPDVCKNCCEIQTCLKKEKIKPFKNIVDRIYIQNNMSCNAKCTYCVFANKERGYRYKMVPIIKSMIKEGILSRKALVYMSGGETTITPEFDELLELLTNNLETKIEILTSGIKYSKSIDEAFKKNRCSLVISIDAPDKETYKKIKQVNCFDTIIENIKKYINESENAKVDILLKYIIVDNINDKKEQIISFLNLANELKIKRVRMDFDYEKYSLNRHDKIPQYYFDLYKVFDEKTKELGLQVETCDQVKLIIENSKY